MPSARLAFALPARQPASENHLFDVRLCRVRHDRCEARRLIEAFPIAMIAHMRSKCPRFSTVLDCKKPPVEHFRVRLTPPDMRFDQQRSENSAV